MLLQGKTALITGGAAGIGRAIGLRMAEEGAAIIVADIDEARAQALVTEIRAHGGRAWFLHFNVADLDRYASAFEEVLSHTGRLDILVNNAGVTRRIPILELSPEDWDWIQNINTRGMFFCLQHAARIMKTQNDGRIVNLSSVSGKGVKGSTNASYAASKAAAIVVARVAANELGRHGIRVNSIVPGPVRTELLDQLEQQIPDVIQGMAQQSALGRIANPEDVANAAVFLCSDLAASITGQSINVDNGMLWD